MPSRAVLRKKQRRDSKRKKAQEEDGAASHRRAPPRLGEESEAAPTTAPVAAARAGVERSRKRAPESECGESPASASTAVTASATLAHPIKRRRAEAAPAPEPMPDGLTRKERRRWETSQRLDRQMTRLNTTAAAVKEMLEEATAAQHGGTASDTGSAGVEAASAPKLRHDPKFKNGMFWRDRKEKRARTLFLGGVPSSFTVRQVQDFISTVVDSDPGAVDYVAQIGKDAQLVEEVEVLAAKHQSKVKHMYVTMASVPLAGCAAAMLNGYKMEGKELRCNFAADKSQREEAIRRRNVAAQR
ncbi:RNA binding protein [Novymonas esmeraldas]|uniref:RNA binding protein n=1 Tax=Novymonas esmeraldas TaxID=1808958 RepID=A0AAW0EUI9_9TRYP